MRSSTYSHPRLVLAGIAVALSTAACGGGTASVPNPFTATRGTAPSGHYRWSPDEIVRAEIVSRGGNDHTAMALIRRLRPGWLQARGQNSFTDLSSAYPIVYIDEIRHGELSTLYQIPSSEIYSMEFFSMADATTRWGTGHPSGVINVVTGR